MHQSSNWHRNAIRINVCDYLNISYYIESWLLIKSTISTTSNTLRLNAIIVSGMKNPYNICSTNVILISTGIWREMIDRLNSQGFSIEYGNDWQTILGNPN